MIKPLYYYSVAVFFIFEKISISLKV